MRILNHGVQFVHAHIDKQIKCVSREYVVSQACAMHFRHFNELQQNNTLPLSLTRGL